MTRQRRKASTNNKRGDLKRRHDRFRTIQKNWNEKEETTVPYRVNEVLAWLADHPRSTAVEVAVSAGRHREWAWRILRELEGKGLVSSELDQGRYNYPRLWSVT